MGRAFCGFPGLLLSRWPLRACCYRRGSADAARSRATDPAAARAEPTAILGLRRCTAPAARRTWKTAVGVSLAIACTVSRRGWRRPDRTPMTICATEEQGRTGRSAPPPIAGGRCVSVPAVVVASGPSWRVPSLRNRSLCCCWLFFSTSARVGASVPRPHATSPEPAALAHAARARCPRPEAPVPGPDGGLGNNGGDRGHPFERPRGPGPVQKGQKGQPQQQPGLAVIH